MLVLLAAGQAAPVVRLHDLTANPTRYDGKVVEVRAAFWVTGEESAHLCSDRLDPDDESGCEGVLPERASGVSEKEWARLIAAGRLAATGNYRVYLTVRGRFEAADSPRWGSGPYPGYRFRILIEKVLRVETNPRHAKK
jgi:hypothetical protein